MGMTAPALYRYVESLPANSSTWSPSRLDKAATAEWRAAAERFPADDPAARLTVACVRFRQWALAKPREFAPVFANPIAEGDTHRREPAHRLHVRALLHGPALGDLGADPVPLPAPGRASTRSSGRPSWSRSSPPRPTTSRPRSAACCGSTCAPGPRSTAWSPWSPPGTATRG
ncbi:hypothetical protein G5V59_19770 [Nocardioides sp. W3-2-3]|uniref:hypothetical protein n=1 Tax=Nocardioides convexus TaxID=2712224 RepID=UPI0024186655|nr:hypothetical protein [Nocardioides convexus]NHA01325.1 hypothetical protein [Nocardioides convexus]